jgi:hypothetical protein
LGQTLLVIFEILLPDDLAAPVALEPEAFGAHVALAVLWSGNRFFRVLNQDMGKENQKAKGKRQKAKVRGPQYPTPAKGSTPEGRVRAPASPLPFAFCLLPF